MEKKFSKIQIAAIKRTAQNVAQFTTKKERIDAKIAELEAEKAALQPMIDAFQGPIKEMTGGYTTEDLVKREVIKTGKFDQKTGKEIMQTRYVLKYPETVIPVEETVEAPQELVNMEMPPAGNDFDLDAANVQQEASHDDDPWA
jgi:hypothetical protein